MQVARETASFAPVIGPAARAVGLQRRVRAVTGLLRKGESYHVELDAIASELGVLAMDLEGYEPPGRVYRPPRTLR